MVSRPKFWPRPQLQRFGLGLGLGLGLEALALASASKIWPRPGLDLVVSQNVIGHFSGKSRVKFGNFVNFSGSNFKSYAVNHYLVLFS